MKASNVLLTGGAIAAGLVLAVTAGDDMSLRGREPDPRVITVHEDERVDIDPPDQLNVTFGPFDGGDAELAVANQDCLDMGGVPEWDNGTWLTCVDVDY